MPLLKSVAAIKLAPTFELLAHKAKLFHLVAEKPIHEAFAEVVGEGMCEALEAAATAPVGQHHVQFSGDAWLRSSLVKVWVDALAASDAADEVATKRSALLLRTSTGLVMELLSKSSFVSKQCPDIVSDTKALDTVLRSVADAGTVKAADVDSAMTTLKGKRLDQLLKALYNTAFGKVVVSEASVLLQVSAKDQAANQKIISATNKLRDPRLPSVAQTAAEPSNSEQASGEAVVSNFSLIPDGSAVEVLEESLGLVCEAVQLWSPSRLLEQAAALGEWAELMVSNSVFYSGLSCLLLQGLMAEGNANLLMKIKSPDEGDRSPGQGDSGKKPTWGDIANLVENNMHDEAPMLDLANNITTVLGKSLPAELKRDISYDDLVARLVEKVVHNCNAREAVLALLQAFAAVDDAPRCPGEALDDWRAKQGLGRESSSFLMKAVKIYECGRDLQHLPLQVGEWTEADDVRMSLEEGDGLRTLVASCQATATLQHELLHCGAYELACNTLKEVVQLVADELAECVMLGSIAMPPKALQPITDAGLASAMQGFLVGAQVAEACKLAAKVYTATNKDHEWPTAALWRLLKKLFAAVPERSVSISAEKFCTGGSEGVAPFWASLGEMERIVHVLLPMFEVAASMAWLHARLFGTEGICRDNKPKVELERAISFVKTTCSATSAMLQGSDMGVLMAMPCIAPLGACVAWFEAAQDTSQHLCRWFLSKYFGEIRSVGDQLAKVTPSFDHIVGSEVLNLKLARSHLLAWPSRPQLNKLAASMYHCIHEASRLHCQWAMWPPLREDPSTKDDLGSADQLFNAGRKAILVIAGVNIVLEHTGDEQKRKAAELVAKTGDDMPQALKDKLKAICGDAFLQEVVNKATGSGPKPA